MASVLSLRYKIRMDPPDLFSLPTELLFYIFLFLTETDLLALCHSCVHLYYIMNDDAVWKRFITDEVRSLELQPQQVSPDNPLPDLGLCENRKHLMRKRRLVSNWRNQKCVKSVVGLGDSSSRKALFYKNNHVLIVSTGTMELWDITSVPVLHCSMAMPLLQIMGSPSKCYVIADKLVICLSRWVYVLQVNVDDKSISILYWFHPKENQVINEMVPGIVEERNNRSDWGFCKMGDRLICVEPSNGSVHHPTIHSWDIAQGCKVGAFVAPLLVKHSQLVSWHDGDLILKTEDENAETSILKFNIVTTKFSHSDILSYHEYFDLYHENHIYTRRIEQTTVRVYNFESSMKVAEKSFGSSYLVQSLIVDGRLILSFDIQVLLLDALSLDTLGVIPMMHSGYWQLRAIPVLGFHVLLVHDRFMDDRFMDLQLWNVSSNSPTLIKNIRTVGDNTNHFFVAEGEEPFPKLVYAPQSWSERNQNLTLWHFW